MALLNPAALWLLPLVALVVILARMRPEPLRRAIATLHLWTDAAGDEGPRASSTRPRINLLFILQVAFALLMVAALAHPQLRRTRRDVAIVVDLTPCPAQLRMRESGHHQQ
ncbi:MAG TPA: BatA domain-containing protein, partial [Vicinamibacterales bacterium]|nr:BatA domain-containing protein [Vicinamibacterales bacterium]